MTIDELRWKKYQVLDDGWICLVDAMGDDSSIVQAARVSYGVGTKKVSDDRTLIRYLYRHAHMTPFEMVEFKFLVRVPMDIWRQWIRHRTASVNEYSTRYSEAIDSCHKTADTDWRLQADSNKQGSGGFIPPEYPEARFIEGFGKTTAGGQRLSQMEKDVFSSCQSYYQQFLKLGVAREQARKILPLSTYTEAYWKCDLRNILNFLSLRMDSHAQLEIRAYADAMYEIVKEICPIAVSAFDDYDHRRGGLLLSALDLIIISTLTEGFGAPPWGRDQFLSAIYRVSESVGWPSDPEKRSREREECWAKLYQLHLTEEE